MEAENASIALSLDSTIDSNEKPSNNVNHNSIDIDSTVATSPSKEAIPFGEIPASTAFGSLSRINNDIQIMSAERWFIRKKCEEYDAKIIAYYNGQLKSINKYIRSMNERTKAIVDKITNLMRLSTLPQSFQLNILDYCDYLSRSILGNNGFTESRLQNQFQDIYHRQPESASIVTQSVVSNHTSTSSKFLQPKLKWHEQMHQQWLEEQSQMRKLEEIKTTKKEEKSSVKAPIEDRALSNYLVIDDDFPDKKKLETWFRRYEGTETEKLVNDVKVSVSKLRDLLLTRHSYCLRVESETLKTIENMVIKKESEIRWATEHRKVIPANPALSSSSGGESAKKRLHTTINYARDKYWSIWFLSSRGLSEQLRRYLSNPKNLSNINLRDPDFGMTALHYASKANKLEAVSLLLEHDADVHLCTPDGRTALHLAAAYCSSSGSKKLMLELLSHGHPDYFMQKDNYGFVAIDLAFQNQNKTAMELLISWKHILDVQYVNSSSDPNANEVLSTESQEVQGKM